MSDRPDEPNMEHCWKRVGVWGTETPRCPLLTDVLHCRNCAVFTRSGRNLLERPLQTEYRDEWGEVMAAEKLAEIPGTLSVVIFRIETEWLALRTRVFSEVVDPERLHHHRLPHRQNPVLLGIINVHGDLQLLVSLKKLLEIEETRTPTTPIRKYARMMVIESDTGKWVFPVDEIMGTQSVHPGMFQNVPVTVAKSHSTYTKGIFHWNDAYVAFLDDELMLYSLTRSVQ